ncbi:hypothetical protein ACFUMH_14775 [Cellulomonas sp. NPDC057328]|uniref:hypothetical protein n=1 Tax=Cellulomonas sp. NPDC057328 TaxID=3346101 RepID=UPI00362E1C08
MPPRLSPRSLLRAGVGLLVAALLVGVLTTLLAPTLPGSQVGHVVFSVTSWLQQVALLVGAALVAVAFGVRALPPADDPRATAPGQPAGRDWN